LTGRTRRHRLCRFDILGAAAHRAARRQGRGSATRISFARQEAMEQAMPFLTYQAMRLTEPRSCFQYPP
jgi:hypothetical protein